MTEYIVAKKTKRQKGPNEGQENENIKTYNGQKYLNVLCPDIEEGRQNKLHFLAASKSP